MGDDDELAFEWFRRPGQICYKNGSTKSVFCGEQEECFDVGMVLPFVNESTWDWRVRAALYGFALLYRWLPPIDKKYPLTLTLTKCLILPGEKNESQT